jgi:4-amino-4-deoxy-L-arabinose transferase-like glycosyltransferase
MTSPVQKKVYQILLLIFLIGTLLRLYKLDDFAIFLGDQGRDAIIMKRIVTFEHLPAVGPSSSVGHVYLGPFYYYFMAPWLALFHMNPIGPVVGVALLSSLFILVAFFIVEDLFDWHTALITSALLTFSATLIDLSRFSWNPNILPLFSFIAIYFFVKSLITKTRLYFILAGFFGGISFQLHYVTFSMMFAFLLISLHYVFTNRRDVTSFIKNFLFAFLAFLFVNIPLILFDVRHQFLNGKNFITLFNNPGKAGAASFQSVLDGIGSLNLFSFGFTTPFFLSFIFLAIFIASFFIWKEKNYRILLTIFLTSLVITSFMTANKFPHYFGILFPLYYVIIAFVATKIFKMPRIRNGSVITVMLIALYIGFQTTNYSFLHREPNKQLEHSEKTAAKIFPLINEEKYRLTAIPDTYGYSAYGYYLEVWGKTPADNLTLEPADQMIVVCENNCNPIGNPQWDVAFFKATKVTQSLTSDNIFIYALTNK